MKRKTIKITAQLIMKDIRDEIKEMKHNEKKLFFDLDKLLKYGDIYSTFNNLKKENELVYREIILNYFNDMNIKTNLEKIINFNTILIILDTPTPDMKDYIENDTYNHLIATDNGLLFLTDPIQKEQ